MKVFIIEEGGKQILKYYANEAIALKYLFNYITDPKAMQKPKTVNVIDAGDDTVYTVKDGYCKLISVTFTDVLTEIRRFYTIRQIDIEILSE